MLKDIEKELYQEGSRTGKSKSPIFSRTKKDKIPLRTNWSEETEKSQTEAKPSKFLAIFNRLSRKIFWIIIAVSVVALGFVGFYFYRYSSGRDVNFSLDVPKEALLGVPFDITVNIENKSANILNDVKISMLVPEGVALVNESQDKRVLELSLGDLEKNGSLQQKIPVIVFSNEQSVRQFQINASYFLPSLGSSNRFQQTKNVEVAIGESGIKLDFIAQQKVLNNADFELEVDYQNISQVDFSGVELQLNYPAIFTLKNANPVPSQGNNVWSIGDLPKNGDKKILTITGKVLGQEQSFFEINGLLSVEVSGQKYVINQKTASLNIATSPLSLNVTVNNQASYVSSLNDTLKYQINYQNNSDTGLNDVVVKATLSGDMFNFASLQSAGFFDSKNNVVTWNAANTPNLRLIPAGGSGSVQFEIKTNQSYPIKRLSDKNFILKVDGEISSPTVPYYVASDKTIGVSELQTKVAGQIVLTPKLFFYEPDTSFSNQGPMPPKVNSPTTFTVHWLITNYSNDVKNIEITSYLQSGVRWTGQVKSNIGTSTPTYNERTQQILWDIDRIIATKSITSAPVETIFQIEVTPNVTQAGQLMPLLSGTTIQGTDEFTGLQLNGSVKALTTDSTVVQ